MIDWSSVISSLLKTLKKDEPEVDKKYLLIKPKVFSDANTLRGLAALKVVLSFIPPAHLAAQVLGLGDMGFKIWKTFALRKEYDHFKFPPVGYNTALFSIRSNTELNTHFGDLVNSEELLAVFNDFSFITNPNILSHKYPQVSIEYIQNTCTRNQQLLGENLESIEQEIQKFKSIPEVDANLREALDALKEIFPSLRDWSLLNSQGFSEVLDIIDTVV